MLIKIIIVVLLVIVSVLVYKVCSIQETYCENFRRMDIILSEKFEEYDDEINSLKTEIRTLKMSVKKNE